MEVTDEFTEKERRLVENFVTNTTSNVFALRNLPEVLKGALFSRYSRSALGLRALLLKDFILNEEAALAAMTHAGNEEFVAIRKAQDFYDRILDGYGDDSIGELGGAHLALENVSMMAAKIIEDCRIGGSPLEKSTRYIYFDQKKNGEYSYLREPVLMTSAYREIYLATCNHLFDTYSALIPPLTQLLGQRFPKEPNISQGAYNASLRAKVLDCLRGLLPTSAFTNLGVFGNGRFFEGLIQKLNGHHLSEARELGAKIYQELAKIIPSFVRRGETEHRHFKAYAAFMEQMQGELKLLAAQHGKELVQPAGASVRIIGYDPDAPIKVAAALLFESSDAPLEALHHHMRGLPEEEIAHILDAAASFRENRRHKSPRALEQAHFTFEIIADFGAYRDLQRHRMLSQERKHLTCDLAYFVPEEIRETEMEEPYITAMERARGAYETIARELPEEAQYVVPMGYNIHWYFHVNLRGLQWLCELRSAPAGHPTYRLIAQEMAKQVSTLFPLFERFFKFVDYDGYELGRLGQEIRIHEKKLGSPK